MDHRRVFQYTNALLRAVRLRSKMTERSPDHYLQSVSGVLEEFGRSCLSLRKSRIHRRAGYRLTDNGHLSYTVATN